MSKQILAITTCRVSTPEQELNNSLGRQAESVKSAAKELGAVIPEDGQWSGSVSSKSGKNVKRTDLKAMLDYCKKHPLVKYLLVHEVDRFMRSVDELFYFEVRFREEVGVKIIYVSQPELNTNDYKAKLFKALEAFKGETSNVERITKSISGQTDALKEGRYPFNPKPGYKKGVRQGIPDIHPVRGPALRKVLLDLANKRITPTQAVKDLNASEYMKGGHSKYKMDKFRKIATDPFYAGVIYMDKQVNYRNENGLHEPLITLDQHYELVRIMEAKKKNQNGPRKNGNPEYPLNNILSCGLCTDKSNNRYVGYPHNNGKNKKRIYHKYRCRACNRYLKREQLHPQIEQQFKKQPVTQEGVDDFLEALDIVWKKKEAQAKQDLARLSEKIKHLNQTISDQAIAAIDPANVSIKQEILTSVANKKENVIELENELAKLIVKADTDKQQFLQFAFGFIDNMGDRFLTISQENRLRCKQIVFPAGFYLDANNKVYTPEISPLITLQATKKDAETSNKVQMVQHIKSKCNFIQRCNLRLEQNFGVQYKYKCN